MSSVARDLSVMVSNGDMNSAADVGVLWGDDSVRSMDDSGHR